MVRASFDSRTLLMNSRRPTNLMDLHSTGTASEILVRMS